MPKPRKRVTHELTEIRTVLGRARTALGNINAWDNFSSYDRLAYHHPVEHTDHELSLMKSALIRAVEDLTEIEAKFGYDTGTNPDGSSGTGDSGGNGPDSPAPDQSGLHRESALAGAANR